MVEFVFYLRRKVIICLFEIDTNIDEVLSLSDFSLMPRGRSSRKSSKTQVYETILEEIRKKIPHSIPSHPLRLPREGEEEDKQELLSPHLLAMHDDDDDDDDISVTDEVSSSSSAENNGPLPAVDYDTDIESGKTKFLILERRRHIFFFILTQNLPVQKVS